MKVNRVRRRPRRTRRRILYDILDSVKKSGEKGINSTTLIQHANLNARRNKKQVKMLTEKGYLHQTQYSGMTVYTITEKGRHIHHEYAQIRRRLNDAEITRLADEWMVD